MNTREKYDGLNGLRTYAILGIVMMHVLANGGYQKHGFILQKLIPSFTNFVFLFMMVSAFGMCCGYYEKIRTGSISVDAFYSKRYEKIWPYFAMLCLIDLIVSPSINSIYEVFANLTLCFGLLPNAQISVIGVGWTLGVIFVFYLLFPFFCYLLGTKRRAWFSAIVAFVFNIVSESYFGASRTNIIYSGVYFVFGGIIYLYRKQLEEFAKTKKMFVWLAAIISVCMYFIIGSNTCTMLLVCEMLLICALGAKKYGILVNPVTSLISGISFEIYLGHMAIYRVIEKLRFTHLVSNDVVSYAMTCFGTIIGSVIFALAAQYGLKKIKFLFCNSTKVFRRNKSEKSKKDFDARP